MAKEKQNSFEARVLQDVPELGLKHNDVVVFENEEQLLAVAGYVDTHPDAVAYAKSLVE